MSWTFQSRSLSAYIVWLCLFAVRDDVVPTDTLGYLNSARRGCNFPYIFVEARGSTGAPGPARLQSATAQRFGLGIYQDLYQKAKAADPENCQPMPDSTLRNFGIVTSLENWTLRVMVAPGVDDSKGLFVRMSMIGNANCRSSQRSGMVTCLNHLRWLSLWQSCKQSRKQARNEPKQCQTGCGA